MARSCPQCGSVLEMIDADSAVCPKCNSRYRVRRRSEAGGQPAPPQAQAAANPYAQPLAPTAPPSAPPPAPVGFQPGQLAGAVSQLGQLAGAYGTGAPCANHPNVPGVNRCKECRKSLCPTCDFAFPGGVHLCPSCATSSSKKLSPKRKTLVGWAYALAIWCTLGMILVFTGAFNFQASSRSEMEAFNMLIGFLVFVPALVGAALGLGCLDKRLGNPPVVVVAAVWNGILLAIVIILTLIGAAM